MSRWTLVGTIVHELAQPAASTALALETAALLMERGDHAGAAVRLAAAKAHLWGLQEHIAGLGEAASGSRSALDLGALLAAHFPAAPDPGAIPVVAPRELLPVALKAIGKRLCLADPAKDVRVSSGGGHVTIRLEGPAKPAAALQLWLSALRRAGLSARCRRHGSRTHVTIRVPSGG